MKLLKRVIILFTALIAASIMAIILTDIMVESTTKHKVYNTTTDLPYNKVGLVLGTSKYLSNGNINLYYQYRIDAAVELYQSGKVDFILVSGDNSIKQYNEPKTIKADLVKHGIPVSKIFLDYAGFRTLDSIVRCKEIFGQDSITVISQQFHNERAVFIASRKGVGAIGFNARDVDANYGLKTKLRERLARVKMVIDLLFGKQPKFLGEKIIIQ